MIHGSHHLPELAGSVGDSPGSHLASPSGVLQPCGLGNLGNLPELQLFHLQNQGNHSTCLLVLMGGLSDKAQGKCGVQGLARRKHPVNSAVVGT